MILEYFYDDEQTYSNELEKLRGTDVKFTTITAHDRYIITIDTEILDWCLELINDILRLNLDNIKVENEIITDLCKKLLRIHNKIVLNEELEGWN